MLLLVTWGIIGCQPAYFQHNEAVSRTDYEAIQADMQTYVEQVAKTRRLTGGMSIGVTWPNAPLISASTGYANLETQHPYTAETPILIAGITKVFTSVMIVQLMEEGRLSFEATLDQWMPDIPHANQVTIQMLLQHTAGFKEYLQHPNLHVNQTYAPTALVQLACELGFHDVNTAYYSTTNHIILGVILEQITGLSWVDALHARILVPLNLTQTFYAGEPGILDTVLVPNYTHDGTDANVAGTLHPSIGWASGGIVSTIPDLLTFYDALLHGVTLVSEDMRERLLTSFVKAEPDTTINAYASLGICVNQFAVNGMTLIGHYGAFGYHSHLVYDPESGILYADTSNSQAQSAEFDDVTRILRYLRQLP